MDARRSRRPKSLHDPAYRGLCDLLREMRDTAGLTQRDLAAAMDEHRSFVWKTESGERRLDAVEFVRWCLACGTDPDAEFQRVRAKVRSPRRRV